MEAEFGSLETLRNDFDFERMRFVVFGRHG